MAAFYWSRPTAAEAAEFGLRPDDYDEPKAEIWPEHEDAFWLFVENHTQWRAGPGGVFGLDYAIFHRELDRRQASPDVQAETMAIIRMIEQAALSRIHQS